MSPEEAKWLAQTLEQYPAEQLSPLLNLGSSTRRYRTEVCPEIDSYVFAPLQQRGVAVSHCDLKSGEGIDIVGDIFDDLVLNRIRAARFKVVLCNSLFEHVVDPGRLRVVLAQILPPGGLLFVSAPFRYPYHPDPIDNGFRPHLDELREFLAPHFKFERGEILEFGCYLRSLKRTKWLVLRDAYLIFAGIVSRDRWRVLVGNYRFLRSSFAMSCAVLRRTGGGGEHV